MNRLLNSDKVQGAAIRQLIILKENIDNGYCKYNVINLL
jgi:hypothetical protein